MGHKKQKLKDLIEDRPDIKKFLGGRKGAVANRLHFEFWRCLVFQSDEQAAEFMSHFSDIPVLYDAYIDGVLFAKSLGIELTPNEHPPVPVMTNQRMASLVNLKELNP